MAEKFLFWIDVTYTEFGIAKFLQEKISADFYVIYDVNHHLKKILFESKYCKF